VRLIRGGDGATLPPELGDLVIVLLAGALAGLRDSLLRDGYCDASELVADLVEISDDYITRVSR
jgi:hypothetical protein